MRLIASQGPIGQIVANAVVDKEKRQVVLTIRRVPAVGGSLLLSSSPRQDTEVTEHGLRADTIRLIEGPLSRRLTVSCASAPPKLV